MDIPQINASAELPGFHDVYWMPKRFHASDIQSLETQERIHHSLYYFTTLLNLVQELSVLKE